MLAWEAVLYFALLDGVALLGLNHLFIAHKQRLDLALAWLAGQEASCSSLKLKAALSHPCAGSWQVLESGHRVPTCTANLSAPDHSLPYAPAKLGQRAGDVRCLEGLHFLAACCKLVYEDMRVAEQTVSRCT